MWPAYYTESRPIISYCWLWMKGYTYGSVMDFDEIIVPRNHTTIKSLLRVRKILFVVERFQNQILFGYPGKKACQWLADCRCFALKIPICPRGN